MDNPSENPKHSLWKAVETQYRDDASAYNRQAFILRKSFGLRHSLPERRCFSLIPLPATMLKAIYLNDHRGRSPTSRMLVAARAPTILVAQPFTPLVLDPNRLGLSFGGFTEDRDVDTDLYFRITRATLFRRAAEPDFAEQFAALQDQSRDRILTTLLHKQQSCSTLRLAIGSFLRGAISFATDSGQALALAGRDNVLFSLTTRGWDYLLLDALPTTAEPLVLASAAIFNKIGRREPLNEREQDVLKRVVNFTRTINGIAIAIGHDGFLSLPGVNENLAMNIAQECLRAGKRYPLTLPV